MSEELNRKRGVVKGKLTVFAKFTSNLKNKLDNNEVLTELDFIQLNDRISRIEKLFDEVDSVQSEIEKSSEDVNEQYKVREEFDELLYTEIALAKFVQSKNPNLVTRKIESRSSVDVLNVTATSNGGASCQQSVKLPTIDLPKFDGSYHNWLEFKDMFESLIHLNETISDIQKFQYLRASLSGEAAQVVKSIELSANNYTLAWDLLVERYSNTRLLVYNHIKAIFNLDAISKESACKIRNLLDSISKHLRTLNALKQPTNKWDTLIIYLITTKLDNATLREWEKQRSKNDLPTLEELKTFLKDRADFLETFEINQTDKKGLKHKNDSQNSRSFVVSQVSCAFCNKSHFTHSCDDFVKLSIPERLEKVKISKLCLNCLKKGHLVKDCQAGNCRKCNRKHNTLLHREGDSTKGVEPHKTEQIDNNEKSSSTCNISSLEPSAEPLKTENADSITEKSTSSYHTSIAEQILLSTICVKVLDKNNKSHTIRALLDSGSQSSFIAKECCDKLQVPVIKQNFPVFGLNNTVSRIEGKCQICIESKISGFKTNIKCFVLPNITSRLPSIEFKKENLNLPKGIVLADPNFNVPSKIDVLLGADYFWDILGHEKIKLGLNMPILQETKFGWVIAGPIYTRNYPKIHCNFSLNSELHEQLERFWQLENCDSERIWSSEESECEKHFIENTTRNSEGRFIVRMPLKDSVEKLGNSKEQAEKRFFNLERKLENNAALKDAYKSFINEYETLGHMTKVKVKDESRIEFYMPHHCVIREDSKTTKLRVVFDASAKTNLGYSLNDLLMVGPTIQNDLITILLRFRMHKYVITADVCKMYRQVLVAEEHRPLQKILWRDNPSEPLITFHLNTVTYGTAAASFLAIRSLWQVGEDYKTENPKIAKIIQRDFYVDDLLTGADSETEAAQICKELIKALQRGCFELRKFSSNFPEILDSISDAQSELKIVNLGENENTKTLGLNWHPHMDNLFYKIGEATNNVITKRTILSSSAQIFDPLGLLAPFVINAKIILQKLWLEGLNWDDPIPSRIQSEWLEFRSQLIELNHLRIPRKIIGDNPINIQLHVFSDASEKAYGACAYLRSEEANGNIVVHLISAKSKVAPLKSVSIPRLELCGAVVAARLANKVRLALEVEFKQCVLWTDSTIVLGWLKLPPRCLKTFVNNRVTEIHNLTGKDQWCHVPTNDNPADALSRGICSNNTAKLTLWWNGPYWLYKDESDWPKTKSVDIELPEKREKSYALTIIEAQNIQLDNYSNFHRLVRIIAYVFRFFYNCKSKESRLTGPITVPEIRRASNALVKISQQETFSREINDLDNEGEVNSKSKILSLNPFLDRDNILRVGGRLRNSNFAYNKKYPIILSEKHHFTKLLFEEAHLRLLHAGPQQLLASIREKYWPIAGRNLAKATVHKCIKCFKLKPKAAELVMGHLPKERVETSAPFVVVGTDYAGPFLLKDKRGRGSKLSKGYVCLFICFTTKAVHLELVSNLTTECFLAALRRFVARRGKPTKIFSDNGTNYVGANSELEKLSKFLQDSNNTIAESLAFEQIEWRFIPPHSPHFGGLWETGVKCAKHHLRRVLGDANLTFEDFYTLLVQIEGILNSRPLTPLSSHPDDLNPLTPAHFLVGRPLTEVTDADYTDVKPNRLSLYQHIQRLKQHFWQRWASEYISELQQREKWKRTIKTLEEGTLVVVKDDNLPPLKWKLGRILSTHPGKDGVARVATIRTPNGIIKRPFTKICPLPVEGATSDTSQTTSDSNLRIVERQPFQGGGHVGD